MCKYYCPCLKLNTHGYFLGILYGVFNLIEIAGEVITTNDDYMI